MIDQDKNYGQTGEKKFQPKLWEHGYKPSSAVALFLKIRTFNKFNIDVEGHKIQEPTECNSRKPGWGVFFY
jgi:hypothetical protein